jgi:hypothetical protein
VVPLPGHRPTQVIFGKKGERVPGKRFGEGNSNELYFHNRTLEDDVLIGFIGLFDLYKHHGDTLVAIALGESKYWDKGCGTDAMRVMLRYSFNELNLRRVGLIVFEYNPRAIRSYEKVVSPMRGASVGRCFGMASTWTSCRWAS